ncbi:ankyrin repeat domain-containing protein 39-like isoform X2 [Artemia franciscana]
MEFEKGIWSAALDGDDSRVKKFLEKLRFDPDTRDRSGYTALHYAARKGALTTCAVLIEAGADVNAQTRSCSSTPLHRSAYQGHQEIVSLLLSKGADPLVLDCDGQTPLHKAAQMNRLDVAVLLLKVSRLLLMIEDRKGSTATDLGGENSVGKYLKKEMSSL